MNNRNQILSIIGSVVLVVGGTACGASDTPPATQAVAEPGTRTVDRRVSTLDRILADLETGRSNRPEIDHRTSTLDRILADLETGRSNRPEIDHRTSTLDRILADLDGSPTGS